MSASHSVPMTSTVTSMDIKSVMQYVPSTVPSKIPPETYSTASATMTTTTPSLTPSTSSTRHFDQIPAYIPKHWIWSRNLFYPHLSNGTQLLYSNSNGALSGSNLSSPRGSTKTESLNSNSPAQITEINSDDDSIGGHEDEKVRCNQNFTAGTKTKFDFSLQR